jgi:hypothetical protein
MLSLCYSYRTQGLKAGKKVGALRPNKFDLNASTFLVTREGNECPCWVREGDGVLVRLG